MTGFFHVSVKETAMNNQELFKKAMLDKGLIPPDIIEYNKINRFPGIDKKISNKAGWYYFSEDENYGMFGDWSSDLKEFWFAENKHRNNSEIKKHLSKKFKQVQEERDKKNKIAALTAQQTWDNANNCSRDHSYLLKKSIKPINIKSTDKNLIIPLYEGKRIVSLQYINPQGNKWFLKDGKTKGAYFKIGDIKNSSTIYIAEGYATGCSIFDTLKQPVVICFSVYNLLPVVTAILKDFPQKEIIICSDNDRSSSQNIGLIKAQEVAKKFDLKIAVPFFKKESQGSDFNDLLLEEGNDIVRKQLLSANFLWEIPEITNNKKNEMTFPLDEFPESLKKALLDVQKITKAPLPLIANSLLTSLSIAVQGHINVRIDNHLVSPSSLFLICVAESGERKSTCDKLFTKVIRKFEFDQKVLLSPKLKEFQRKMQLHEIQEDKIKKLIARTTKNEGNKDEHYLQKLNELDQKAPTKPKIPKIIYSDATIEALKLSLGDYPCAALLSSEGGIILGSYALSKDNMMSTMGTLNTIWDGENIETDRVTSKSSSLESVRLTVSIQIQENTLRKFLEKTQGLARGIGFLARFLFTKPHSTQGSRFYDDQNNEAIHLAEYNSKIETILQEKIFINKQNILELRELNLSKEAKNIWKNFYNSVEKELGVSGSYSSVRDVASKIADNAARIAGLFQYYDKDMANIIDASFMKKACKIASWYLEESKVFYESILNSENNNFCRAIEWLKDYQKKRGVSFITKRDFQRNITPSQFREKKNFDNLIKKLQKENIIKVRKKGQSTYFFINPKIYDDDNCDN